MKTDSRIQILQDRFAELSEEWALACEIFGHVQSKDLSLSEQASSGLATYAFTLSNRIEKFEEHLRSLNMTRLQRFENLVQQSVVLKKYYNPHKQMMEIEAIWKDFEHLPVQEQAMLTFMILVWNPFEHRYPPIEAFSVLQEAESLTENDKKIIEDWLDHPFLVMDDKGEVE